MNLLIGMLNLKLCYRIRIEQIRHVYIFSMIVIENKVASEERT